MLTRYIKTAALIAAVLMFGVDVIAQDTALTVPPPFALHFDDTTLLSKADSSLRITRSRLQKMLQDSLHFTAEIHLVSSIERFDSLVGSGFPEWGAAAALPALNLIVIKSPNRFHTQRPLSELLAHEYSHLALKHRVGWRHAPRWFNEGLAQVVSAEWEWSSGVVMAQAVVFGNVLSLEEIDRMNTFGQGQARLAYAQSYLAVHYLFDQYGTWAFNVFLDSLAAGATVDNALQAATGSNSADFQSEYRVYIAARFNAVSLLADTMYLWIGLAIVVIVGAVLKYRKRKDYYKKWDEEEKYASTDFDYGDSDNPEQPDDDEPWRQ